MDSSIQRQTLNIFSLKHLALQLGISLEELNDIATNQKKHWKNQKTLIYNDDGSIKKTRITYNCDDRLRRVLTAIDKRLLKKITLPNAVHGSRIGRSNITNAKIHLGQPHLLNLDIKNFFPSIRPNQVFNVFKYQLNCSPEVARFLSKLCTAENHVPQGFNTSSSIANLVLIPAIQKIDSLCVKMNLKFTIQVDDIAISGYKIPKELVPKVEKILAASGFQLHPDKRILRTNKQQQVVTGVVVNKKPNMEQYSYEDLRAKLSLCKKHGSVSFLQMHPILTSKGEMITNPARLRSHLQGKLNYLKQLNPDKANSLLETFKEITWEAQ